MAFGEALPPRPEREPDTILFSATADPFAELLRLNDAYRDSYVQLLARATTDPAAQYDLQLKVQELDSIVCNMLYLLTTAGFDLYGKQEIINAKRMRVESKNKMAADLEKLVAAEQANLKKSLEGPDGVEARAAGEGDPSDDATLVAAGRSLVSSVEALLLEATATDLGR